MRAFLRALAIAVLAGAALLPAAVHAQAISVEGDLNMPAYDGPLDADHEEYATGRNLALRVGWLSHRYEAGGQAGRWSLFVSYQSRDTEWRTSNPSTGHRMATAIEFGRDWRLVGRARRPLSVGLAAGTIFIKSRNDTYSNSCDTPFCNLPDGGWLVSAYARYEVALSSGLDLVLGARGRLTGPDRAEVFPFAAGPVFSLGVQLHKKGDPLP